MAQNNLGPANVALDDRYQGTFEARTKFASARVYEQYGSAGRVEADTPGTMVEQRTKYVYDHLSTSRISGWRGQGKRPRRRGDLGQGHVEVVSSLSPVMLQLGD
jgi:hypothetical protein